MRYTYEFSIWIDGKNAGSWTKPAADLLRRTLSTRQVLENITEKEFGNLREELWHNGFEFHEIERILYSDREMVL